MPSSHLILMLGLEGLFLSRTERLCLHLERFQGHGWRAESHFRGLLLRAKKAGDIEGREEQTDGAWVGGLAVQAVPRRKCFTRQGWHEAQEELEGMVWAMEGHFTG